MKHADIQKRPSMWACAIDIGLYLTLITTFCLAGNMVYAQTVVPSDMVSSGFIFQKNLSYGERAYPDVNHLQYFLDQDSRTAVASSGPGSIDDVSSFFGEKTADAVSRFQSLYPMYTLEPLGLSQPTGFFGNLSRAKANEMLASMRTAASNSPKIQNESSTTVDQTVRSSSSSFNSQDNLVISLVSAKVDKQMRNISDNSVRQGIKDGILAKLKSEILKTKIQAFSDPSQESGWDRFVGPLKTAFLGTVAYAAQISEPSTKIDSVLAQVGGMGETPFGGEYLFSVQCTCGDDNLNYILNYTDNNMLSLLYEPGQSKLFANNDEYGTYQVGTYSQASQECEIEAGDDCVDIEPDGIYGSEPGTGTSMLKTDSGLCMK